MASNASTASLLVLLQLGSRLVTFTLNQALLAYTTPAAFGTATVQLEPLLNTVLFLCREGIRGALARQSKQNVTSKQVTKLSLIPVALGVPVTLAGFWLYARNTSPSVYTQDYFATSVILYALATVTELASEPYFNYAQLEMNVKLRVSIEGSAVIVRAVTTLLLVLHGRERMALIAFAAGQLSYAVTIMARYAWHYRSAKLAENRSQGDTSTGVPQLAFALTKQSFVKQVLTEGDKIIVSRISPIEDQGGYGLALNYGSLVARILFQPLEESSRLFYSREIGGSQKSSDEVKSPQKSKCAIDTSVALLGRLVKLQIYLSLIFVCFCPFYTTPLLYHVLRGSRWMNTSAPRLLREYLFLLPLLGFNGILEAFVQATASEKQLGQMSKALLGWSAIYCACCYVAVSLLGMKEDALIWANGVTMACRIAYSAGYINQFCKSHQRVFSVSNIIWQSRLPVLACVLSTPVLSWGQSHFRWTTISGMLQHVALGGFCFLICASLSLYTERNIIGGFINRTHTADQRTRKVQ